MSSPVVGLIISSLGVTSLGSSGVGSGSGSRSGTGSGTGSGSGSGSGSGTGSLPNIVNVPVATPPSLNTTFNV